MPPRVLFVVTGSYGDLSLAIGFVYGQDWADRAAVALPGPLFQANHGRLPLRVYRYASVGDILDVAAAWDAQIVIFLSAYGLPIERLASPAGVRQLVRRLRDQRRRVATTDPFLGSASTIAETEIRAMLPPSPWLRLKALLGGTARRVAQVLHDTAAVLGDVTHLYPTPVDGVVDPTRVRAVSFFNPETTRRHPEWELADASHTAADSPRTWLFVLAPNDVFIQQRRWGTRQFVGRLVGMFRQTHLAGKRPVIVAPAPLMKLLARPRRDAFEAELVRFSSYPEFAARLLAAEYAFYWNAFSCSALMVRTAKRLPVFFFDQGHVAQFSRHIYADGLRAYYGGREPPTLPFDALDPGTLATRAAEQATGVQRLLDYWGRSPPPWRVLELLLDAGPSSAS